MEGIYVEKKNLILVAGILIYRIILDLAFCKLIAPLYSYYMQLKHIDNADKQVISFILLGVILLFTRFDDAKLSNVIMNMQLMIIIIPMMTLYAYSDRNSIYMIMVCGAYILQELTIGFGHRMQKMIPDIVAENAQNVLVCMITIFLAGAFVYTFGHFGIPGLSAFVLENVYDIRSEISYSFPFSYIVPWVFKIICIFLIVIGLYYHKYVLAVTGLIFQVYFFLTYANKTTLFAMILVIGCYFIMGRWNIIKATIWGMSGIVTFAGIIYITTGKIILLSYFVRRTLFVPATIKFAYYDYFSNNRLLYFGENFIGRLFDISSPYSLEAPKLIAKYLGVPNSHCNTGYLGDAYANMGTIGVLIFSFILALIILLIEKITEELPKQVTYPFAITLFYNLNDSALLTWLLGGGAGIAIIVFWLYKNIIRKNCSDVENI